MNNLKNTEHIFDTYAREYQEKFMDLEPYHSSLDQFSEYIKSGSKLLDIGCGPGSVSVYLQKKNPEIRIFGIDLSRNMLELAKRNIPFGEFRKMDCRNIDSLEEKFDAIVCGFCLPYLSEPEVADLLKNAAAILNSEGVLYLSTMVTDQYKSQCVGPSQGGDLRLLTHYHQAASLRDALKNNGFSLLHEQQLEEQERDGTKYHDQILIARRLF